MNGRNIIEAVGGIDDELIENAESTKAAAEPRKRRRTAIIAACAAVCLIAGAAIAAVNLFVKDEPTEHVAAVVDENDPSHSPNALYVPAIELPKSTDGAEMDMIGLVVYKGGIYTQAEWYSDEQAEKLRQAQQECEEIYMTDDGDSESSGLISPK